MNALNPSYDTVKVGDTYLGGHSGTFAAGFMYVSTVLAVGEIGTRFGNPDRIVTVRIESSRGTLVDASKNIWVSQLLRGLV